MPIIIFVTVVASVGLGVLTAYAAVIGILNMFGTGGPMYIENQYSMRGKKYRADRT